MLLGLSDRMVMRTVFVFVLFFILEGHQQRVKACLRHTRALLAFIFLVPEKKELALVFLVPEKRNFHFTLLVLIFLVDPNDKPERKLHQMQLSNVTLEQQLK